MSSNVTTANGKHTMLFSPEKLAAIAKAFLTIDGGKFTIHCKQDDSQRVLRAVNKTFAKTSGKPFVFYGKVICESAGSKTFTNADFRRKFVDFCRGLSIERPDLKSRSEIANVLQPDPTAEIVEAARSYISHNGINFGDLFFYRLVTTSKVYMSAAADVVKRSGAVILTGRDEYTVDTAKLLPIVKKASAEVAKASAKYNADIAERRSKKATAKETEKKETK
jgi:hypothetical protein